MYGLEIYHRVRRAVLRDGMSEREASRVFGVDRGTVSKMLRFSEPPGYRRTSPRPRSLMDAHADFVDEILTSEREAPRKQRHTVKRILERLRPSRPLLAIACRAMDERGFEGGYTTVRDYVRPRRQALKEAFVPLAHPRATRRRISARRRSCSAGSSKRSASS